MKKFYNDLDMILCSVSLVHIYKYPLQVLLKNIKKFWFSLQIEKKLQASYIAYEKSYHFPENWQISGKFDTNVHN